MALRDLLKQTFEMTRRVDSHVDRVVNELEPHLASSVKQVVDSTTLMYQETTR